jgi:hypothetical protein
MLRSGRRVSLIAMWLLLFPVYFLSSIFKLLWVSAPGSPRSSTRDKEATVFFYLTSQRASQFWKANFLQQTSQRCRLQGHWEQPRTTGRSVQSCPGCSHSLRGSGQQALHRVPAPSACPAHTTESCHFTSINELPHSSLMLRRSLRLKNFAGKVCASGHPCLCPFTGPCSHLSQQHRGCSSS